MKSIIVLHGAIGSKDQLTPLIELLSSDFDVSAFNFSGHGGEQFKSEFHIPLFAKELSQFIEEKNLIKPVIFGYSMGGYVALKLAKSNPELMHSIITLGTKFKWSPEIAAKEVRMLNPEVIAAKIPKFAAALEQRHAPNNWKEVLAKTADMMVSMGEQNVLSLNDYESIDVPVYVGLADKDEMVSQEETLEVVSHLTNSSYFQVSDSFHPIERVNLEQLSEIIKRICQ